MSDSLENYKIHICLESELLELQQFIHVHWKSNHALVSSKELMDWQHYDEKNRLYNFVIAKHIRTDEIYGILGFIPTNHFDTSLKGLDLWLAIWKVRDDVPVSGLGLLLLNFLISNRQPRSITAFGLSPRVIPIYKYMGYKVGVMKHYYLVNNDIVDFHLIGNFNGQHHSESIILNEKKMVRYEKSNFPEFHLSPTRNTQVPIKSYAYIYNRYLSHPVYHYEVYGIMKHESMVGVLVLRLLSHNSHHALRVVDYFGDIDELSGISKNLQRMLKDYNAEFIDFYNLGINEQILFSNGFIKKGANSHVVIPNFFEPFEKKNVELDYAYKCNDDSNFFIYKGDSDQDRPNTL